MKTLYLVRHGKSGWENPMLTDFERPLTERGRQNSTALGEFFKTSGIMPGKVLSSPANRALTTARLVCRAMDYALPDITVKERIYEAGPGDLLEVIRATDNSISSLMLFGHNPGFIMLAALLTGQEIELYPTGSVFAIEIPVEEWKDIKEGENKCLFFQSPKRKII